MKKLLLRCCKGMNGSWKQRGALAFTIGASVLTACGAAPPMGASSAADTKSVESATAPPDETSPGVIVANVSTAELALGKTSEGHASEGHASDAEPPPPPPPDGDAHKLGNKPDPKKPKDKSDKLQKETPTFQKSDPAPAPAAATTTNSGNQISAEDVDAAIAPQLHALRACATVDSSVSVRLSIAPGGKVAEATAMRSSPDDARLRDCVELALRSLYFHASPERGSALSFDLDLRPLAAR